MKKINFLIILFLLILFISLIAPTVLPTPKIIEKKQLGEALKINSAQKTQSRLELSIPQQESSEKIKYFRISETDILKEDIKEIEDNRTFPLILNQSQIESFDIIDENKSLDSSTEKAFQIPISNTPSKSSCQKIEKSKISGFVIPETKFPFQEKKEQPIIHPTLEETITLKANNEIKKKRETMANISFDKTIPKIISQKEIKLEEVSEKLERDSEFKETYEYAKELGFTKTLNESLIMFYDDGTNITFIPLISEENNAVFLSYYQFSDRNCEGKKERTLIMTLKEEKNITMLSIFNNEGGMNIDLLNKSIISTWGHHSCFWTDCMQYCFDFVNINYPWYYGGLCMKPCELCVPIAKDVSISPYLA